MANDAATKAQIQVIPFNPDSKHMVQALYDIGNAIVKESTTFKHDVMKDKIDALVADHKLHLDDVVIDSRTCCFMAFLSFSDAVIAPAVSATVAVNPVCVGAVAGFVSDSWFDGSTSLNDFFLGAGPLLRECWLSAIRNPIHQGDRQCALVEAPHRRHHHPHQPRHPLRQRLVRKPTWQRVSPSKRILRQSRGKLAQLRTLRVRKVY